MISKTLCATILALSAIGFVGSASAQDAIIHAGHVLAVPGESYERRQTIMIEDGKITSIVPGYQLPAERGRVIDLKDAYVLPGLIDAHVHLLTENGPGRRLQALEFSEADYALQGARHARLTIEAGFTTVQDVGGVDEAIFSLRDAIARGDVIGPRVRASGRAVTPTGGHGDSNGFSPALSAIFTGNTCNGADDCRRATRQVIKNGADLIKITATGGVLSNTAAGLEQQLFDDEIAAIVQTAATMGRKVTAHAHGKGGIEAALRNGVQSIEHGTYLDDETVALFNETGATLVPTVLAGATVTGWTNEPWLPEPSRAKAAIVGPLMLDMLRTARTGGVRVAFGTDTGVSVHGGNAEEFLLMVEAGYTPEEAIYTATVIASQHLEMDSQIGTLEVGKLADLVAFDGDPLEDIEEVMSVDFVMKGGDVVKSGL
ncbi:MAG: amidohydrolase family protein [Pseudomonadota bacterium]